MTLNLHDLYLGTSAHSVETGYLLSKTPVLDFEATYAQHLS